MGDENTTATENSQQNTYDDGEARVEDFHICPTKFDEDERKMHVWMRVAGGEAAYYVSASVRFSECEAAAHEVTVYRVDPEELVDEFRQPMWIQEPEDTFDAVQAAHEMYIQSAKDWYEYARGADTTEY